jgi:hypothetical protein
MMHYIVYYILRIKIINIGYRKHISRVVLHLVVLFLPVRAPQICKNVWSGFGDIRFVTLTEILIYKKNQNMGQLGYGMVVCMAPSVWSNDNNKIS